MHLINNYLLKSYYLFYGSQFMCGANKLFLLLLVENAHFYLQRLDNNLNAGSLSVEYYCFGWANSFNCYSINFA